MRRLLKFEFAVNENEFAIYRSDLIRAKLYRKKIIPSNPLIINGINTNKKFGMRTAIIKLTHFRKTGECL